jgi:hypothetical protein
MSDSDLNPNDCHQMCGGMIEHLQGLLNEVRALLPITNMWYSSISTLDDITLTCPLFFNLNFRGRAVGECRRWSRQ